jgi:hypothetical protein
MKKIINLGGWGMRKVNKCKKMNYVIFFWYSSTRCNRLTPEKALTCARDRDGTGCQPKSAVLTDTPVDSENFCCPLICPDVANTRTNITSLFSLFLFKLI